MPTKQHPGAFDCYRAALPDEPIFVILGRDIAGPATLNYWAQQRIALGKSTTEDDRDRITAAVKEASDMRDWRERNLELSIDGVAPWNLPRHVIDDIEPGDEEEPYYPENQTTLAYAPAPTQTFQFAGCARAYTGDEIAEILAAHERERPLGKAPELGMAYAPSPGPVGDPYEAVAEAMKPKPGERVMIDTRPDDLAHGPEVAPHRFSMFHKGERYAYAKGLEVNPTHLPVALDAMALDGWHLIAIFGETDSKNVGFIFERRGFSSFEVAHGYGRPEAPPRRINTEPLDTGPLPCLDPPCGADGRGRGLEP